MLKYDQLNMDEEIIKMGKREIREDEKKRKQITIVREAIREGIVI